MGKTKAIKSGKSAITVHVLPDELEKIRELANAEHRTVKNYVETLLLKIMSKHC